MASNWSLMLILGRLILLQHKHTESSSDDEDATPSTAKHDDLDLSSDGEDTVTDTGTVTPN